MNTKKRLLLTAVIAAAAIFGIGIGIMAAGTLGSRDDPLVTLSYMNERFKAELVQEFEQKISEKSAELSAKVDAYIASLPPPGTDNGASPENAFSVVSLTKGEVIRFGAGAEVLPREGTAIFIGSSLSDSTTGESLSPDSAAAINHMYVTAADGDSLRADSDLVTLLVRGKHEITS